MSYKLKFTPIGGVGQIGGNMSLVESRHHGIIIDSGTLFPRDKVLGINYLIPDYSEVDFEKFNTIFITHCHEDHIGGLRLLLKKIPNLKIYSSYYTSIVIKNKLKKNIDIEVIQNLQVVEIGDLKIIPFEVDHSTAQTFGFYVNSQDQGLVFASDFKCHQESKNVIQNLNEINNHAKDLKNFCAFLDSTSVRTEGFSTRESEVYEDLKSVLSRKKRSLVTLFSSNIHRLKTIVDISKEINKKVVLYGRSMHFSFNCAVEAGLLKESDAIDIEKVKEINHKHILLAPGCQGSFRSTLKNISKNISRFFKVEEGDQIVFSSSIIPGNEKQIQGIYNAFVELGADIITYKDYKIHCSGHAGQGDLSTFITNLDLTHYVPIHGETFLLKKHYEFIKKEFPHLSTYFVRDFDEIVFSDEVNHYDKEGKKPLLVDNSHNEIPRGIISQRRKIAENGIVIMNKQSFELSSYGVNISEENLFELENENKRVNIKEKNTEEIRIYLRRLLEKNLGYRPIVLIH